MEAEFEDLQALENGVLQAVGSLPLTAEQASSLRSAILLLSEGDGVGHFPIPSIRGDNRPARQDDRQAFAGMYS